MAERSALSTDGVLSFRTVISAVTQGGPAIMYLRAWGLPPKPRGPRNQYPPQLRRGATTRKLANTLEPGLRGKDRTFVGVRMASGRESNPCWREKRIPKPCRWVGVPENKGNSRHLGKVMSGAGNHALGGAASTGLPKLKYHVRGRAVQREERSRGVAKRDQRGGTCIVEQTSEAGSPQNMVKVRKRAM